MVIIDAGNVNRYYVFFVLEYLLSILHMYLFIVFSPFNLTSHVSWRRQYGFGFQIYAELAGVEEVGVGYLFFPPYSLALGWSEGLCVSLPLYLCFRNSFLTHIMFTGWAD